MGKKRSLWPGVRVRHISRLAIAALALLAGAGAQTGQSTPTLIPPRTGYNFPAKETLTEVDSGVFTCPSAGFYVLAVVSSGSATAKSSAAIRAALQMSQI